jgi:electron-transferring-flavoprotein dehydrogenase
MESKVNMDTTSVERQGMEVDIVCVGFGPAVGGFLTTLSREMVDENGMPLIESQAMPGMPLQVLCYERADDIGFGVSGVVTSAKGIRETFPDLNPEDIPMAHAVEHEKVAYLLDPIGASRRSPGKKLLDGLAKIAARKHHAFELPYIPPFLRKDGGIMMSIGQFNQWVGSQLMGSGLVQLWPGTPVGEPLIEDHRVVGVRLVDQGVEKNGEPSPMYMPGMDVRAALTVVGDGPVGPVGRALDDHFGMPDDCHQDHWAVGMKMVVDLPEGCTLEPGTVIHTLGYPEPEIFGFMYVMPGNTASLGIFVPSFFESPVRTCYRYLQHWMQHPYLWRHLEGGTLRSWGAKTLAESGRAGEPFLVGDGYARVGEGSGSTNVLTGSGVDEAWTTGVLLAQGVVELAKAGKPFDRPNLAEAYILRRRESRLDRESKVAEHARDGFVKGFVTGMIGMGLAGLTGGRFHFKAKAKKTPPSLEEYYRGKVSPAEIEQIRAESKKAGTSMHDALMDKIGWPAIAYDGKLLISHQDALLLGGKVQAPAGYADHVQFLYPNLCERCGTKICVEVCSGQAITRGENEVPEFDREKCVHCGACIWNCPEPNPDNPRVGNIAFRAGAGGLHSAEN